ncbi:dihydrodipicolinate synthase family protein [Mesorhizobium atlanticum]|uniref:Dihydrodipicolinate synthase family protein n=1 Tax=Mesorhizobium atlanticum TaxID=2233532 RepID=A0A330GVQ1_9HYPH|nr:dihydrodipicolinate synthase family protein [Mesorhizobium atlanticum]RAZ78419.1 dihydrodipicolinate synthase family protein [Mesorhizobium atlanticum]
METAANRSRLAARPRTFRTPENRLLGVIAAVPTPIDASGSPDHARFLQLARDLLDAGCDALNMLGTTGEATSFSLKQRVGFMEAAAKALPRDRLMVGTGAAALADARQLAQAADELEFAAALVLPPFYYKGITDYGIVAYFDALVNTTSSNIPLYLYNFPALSGVPFGVELIARLRNEFGNRIAGLKDSSGNIAYAREVASMSADLSVFPSNEATLLEARSGVFAGCISATASLSAEFCASAFHKGDAEALQKAMAVRQLFDGKPLVPCVKAVLARDRGDDELARVVPPLVSCAPSDADELYRHYCAIGAAAR